MRDLKIIFLILCVGLSGCALTDRERIKYGQMSPADLQKSDSDETIAPPNFRSYEEKRELLQNWWDKKKCSLDLGGLDKTQKEELLSLADNHIITVGEQGNVIHPAKRNKRISFEKQFTNIMTALTEWTEANRSPDTNSTPRIMIFAHGGLVTPEAARENAAQDLCLMMQSFKEKNQKELQNKTNQAQSKEDINPDAYFPIFFVWTTGPFDTYLEQVGRIRDGERRKRPNPLTATMRVASHIAEGYVKAPVNLTRQFNRYWRSTTLPTAGDYFLDPCYHWRTEGKRKAAVIFPKQKNIIDTSKTNLDKACEEENHEFLDRISEELNKRNRPALEGHAIVATSPIRLALSTPLIDGLGKHAWDNMVRRTRVTLHRPSEFQYECLNLLYRAKKGTFGTTKVKDEDCINVGKELNDYPLGTGGFSKFLAALQRCYLAAGLARKADPNFKLEIDWAFSDEEPKDDNCLVTGVAATNLHESLVDKYGRPTPITIIGHSMGAIVFNELIHNHPKMPYKDIVYLGAASNIREFQINVLPVLQRRPEITFYNLMLHPHSEAREYWKPKGIPLATGGSLLEWIDEMFEPERSILDKTLGKWRNVRASERILTNGIEERACEEKGNNEKKCKAINFRVFSADWNGRVTETRDNDIKELDDLRGCHPTTHGAFDEGLYWEKDYWTGSDEGKNGCEI